MSKERADFHVHLGDRTAEGIVEEALANEVSVLAVMDRGLVRPERLERVQQLAKRVGIEALSGIECLTELTIGDKHLTFELIGINFDIYHQEIFRAFNPQGELNQKKHGLKIEHQRDFLTSLGLEIRELSLNHEQWDAIAAGANDTAYRFCKIASVDDENLPWFEKWQTEITQHLQERPQDMAEPFAKFLYWQNFAPGRVGFKPWFLDFQTILDSIHTANGVVILAHPRFSHIAGAENNNGSLVDHINDLFDLGVDGLEGWYGGLNQDKLDLELAHIAYSRGRLILGGSGKDASYTNRIIGRGSIEHQGMFISARKLIDINKRQKEQQIVPAIQ